MTRSELKAERLKSYLSGLTEVGDDMVFLGLAGLVKAWLKTDDEGRARLAAMGSALATAADAPAKPSEPSEPSEFPRLLTDRECRKIKRFVGETFPEWKADGFTLERFGQAVKITPKGLGPVEPGCPVGFDVRFGDRYRAVSLVLDPNASGVGVEVNRYRSL